MTVKSRASRLRTGSQLSDEFVIPWMSSSTGPLPAVR